MTPSARYRVAKADLDRDRDTILELWKRHLPNHPYPARRYDWGNRTNPFAAGRRWLLSADDQVVGTAGMVIRRFKSDDTVVLAGRAGGFGVDKAHRFLGPALTLQRAVMEDLGTDGLDFIYGSAPPDVIGIFNRLGYQSIGELVRYVKVLDAEPYLRRHIASTTLCRWLAPPVNLVLGAVTRTTWRPSVVRSVDRFDARFDDLWRRASPHYGVTTERTSQFLTWRFDSSVHYNAFMAVTVTARDDHRLLGYAVYDLEDGHAHIADLFAEDADEALDTVLAAVTYWVRNQGAASIVIKCLSTGVLGRVMERAGFGRRTDGAKMTVIVSPAVSGARAPGWAERWYFLGADDFWN